MHTLLEYQTTKISLFFPKMAILILRCFKSMRRRYYSSGGGGGERDLNAISLLGSDLPRWRGQHSLAVLCHVNLGWQDKAVIRAPGGREPPTIQGPAGGDLHHTSLNTIVVTGSPELERANPALPSPPLLQIHPLSMPFPLLEAQVAHVHLGLISENLTLWIYDKGWRIHTRATASLSGLLIYRKASWDLDNPLIPLVSAFIFQSVMLSCQERQLNRCFRIAALLS